MIRAHACFDVQGELDRHPPLRPSESDMSKEDVGTHLSLQAPLQAARKSIPTANSEVALAGDSLTVPNGGSAMPVALSPATDNGGITALIEQLPGVSNP